ncbi:MAG: Undecaprenyl diphosphate synthase (EC [uncultured Campylobacterales bacterium]|uniref:Isoprenyl transferase n=1 Tax=uncultured Campylobacterales bacterium TaxID=352960 RepID=A0A6S6TIG5_9BACT|nr:MAG: Undecaprenyl diphosphate synthase (EC [uncultured Campylobacterales bacterium]
MNQLKHLAIIMDGNGRWATNQNKLRIRGHEQGIKTVESIMTYCARDTDIETLTLYAFSTENWKRPKLEVDFLMMLLDKYLKSKLKVYMNHNIRFETIGDLSKFSNKLKERIEFTKEITKNHTGLKQVLAINYGAKDEIIRSFNKLLESSPTSITEDDLDNVLDIKDPVDLMIRTGGEHRISNFLLWQIAYSEIRFTDTLWPEFGPEELSDIIKNYTISKRRFGGL